MRYDFEIQTSHFQFLVGDRGRGPTADTTILWETGGAVATSPDLPEVVGVGTVRFGGNTRVSIEIIDTPLLAKEDWTELGRFSVTVTTGSLAIWGPEAANLSSMPAVPLAPGKFSGVAYVRGTEGSIDDAAPNGPDEYRIVLRPADEHNCEP